MFPSCDDSFCSFLGKLAKNHQISWHVSVSFLKGGPEAVVMRFKPVSPGGECLLIGKHRMLLTLLNYSSLAGFSFI